jgi:hypothetical protein
MFICRIDNQPKTYYIDSLDKIKYFNTLIRNYVLEFHYANENKEVAPRKIYCEELQYEFCRCYKYDNYSYIVGLERNNRNNLEEIVIHFITDENNFDLNQNGILEKIKNDISNVLEMKINLSRNQITVL